MQVPTHARTQLALQLCRTNVHSRARWRHVCLHCAHTHTHDAHTHAHTRARAHAPPPPTVCGCRYEIVVAHRPHINPDTLWSHTKVKEAHEYYLRSVLGRRLDDAAKEWVDALVMGTIWSGSPYMRARDAARAP